MIGQVENRILRQQITRPPAPRKWRRQHPYTPAELKKLRKELLLSLWRDVKGVTDGRKTANVLARISDIKQVLGC